MEYFICGCIGYGLGCLNPAYFISKWEHKDIRNTGTGNLGTTNAFINLGKGWGCFVLLFDMLKAFAASVLFPIYSYKLHSVAAFAINCQFQRKHSKRSKSRLKKWKRTRKICIIPE